MSSTYRISAVRVEMTADHPHEHVSRVRIGFDSGTGMSRADLVAQLNSPHGDRYDTFANGELQPVVLRTCPTCPATDYVTTKSAHTAANHLLELPRF